jgi:hypothetical protein
MSNSISLAILSIVLAVCYGVAFSFAYQDIPIDGKLAGLFALCGVATALLIFGVWRMVPGSQNKKSAP